MKPSRRALLAGAATSALLFSDAAFAKLRGGIGTGTPISAQLSVSGPSEGTVNNTFTFTFSITHAAPGTTTVTPSAAFTGTWSPTTVSLTGASPSATATFTPTQQGPTNAIGATGNNGAVAAATINFPVYSVISTGSKTTLISQSDITSAGIGFIDTTLSVVDAGGGNKYFFFSDPGAGSQAECARITGTVTNPVAGGSGTLKQKELQSVITAADYRVVCNVLKNVPGFNGWVGFYHFENWPGGTVGNQNGDASRYWAGIGMATSTDDGITWVDCGHIITHNAAYSNSNPPPWSPSGDWACDIGGGGYLVWSDGYVYVYFMDDQSSGQDVPGAFWWPNSTNWLAVARCSLSAIATAANATSAPTFHKWHDEAWTELGLGGLSDPLETGNPPGYWGDVYFHTDINAILVTGSVGNPFQIGTVTPSNPSYAYVTQAFSPTGPFSARQIVNNETTGTPPQPVNPSMWSDITDGDNKVSNSGLQTAWIEYSYPGLGPENVRGRTATFDTTGAFGG